MKALLLVFLLTLAGCAASASGPREVAQQGRVFLPTTPASGYQWPARGFGHPPEAGADSVGAGVD